MHHQHVAGRPEEHGFGNTAQHMVPGGICTTVPDHDEIGPDVVGRVDDGPGRFAANEGLCGLDAVVGSTTSGRLEREISASVGVLEFGHDRRGTLRPDRSPRRG